MALITGAVIDAVMAVVVPGFRGDLQHRAANLGMVATAIAVFAVSLHPVRGQKTVSDRILSARVLEIGEMKQLVADLEHAPAR